jgi:hypothetical protein
VLVHRASTLAPEPGKIKVSFANTGSASFVGEAFLRRCPFLALSVQQGAANGTKRRHKANLSLNALRAAAGAPASTSLHRTIFGDTCARLCDLASGELDHPIFLGHVSTQTTEGHVGCKQQPVDFFGQKQTRLGMLAFTNSHMWEHYGNLVTYMRLKNIVPPSSER